jgi:hypothetical protein
MDIFYRNKGKEFPSGKRYRWKESKRISADSRLLWAPLSRRLSLGNSPGKKYLFSISYEQSDAHDFHTIFTGFSSCARVVSTDEGTKLLFVFVPFIVDPHVVRPLFRNFSFRENGFHGTFRDTGSTVDTFLRIDIQLLVGFEVRAGMNAIHRACIHASGVFYADTGFTYDESHRS